jgi:hypothetical protein
VSAPATLEELQGRADETSARPGSFKRDGAGYLPVLPADPAPEPGRVGHLFVISLAGPDYEAAFGAESKLPYLAATLRPQGELLSNYSLLDPAALPNGVATVSGQPPNSLTKAGCASYDAFPAGAAFDRQGVVAGAGCVYPVEALTVADQLTSARLCWGAYADGMVDATGKPQNCVHPEPPTPESPAPGGYAATQNPFCLPPLAARPRRLRRRRPSPERARACSAQGRLSAPSGPTSSPTTGPRRRCATCGSRLVPTCGPCSSR